MSQTPIAGMIQGKIKNVLYNGFFQGFCIFVALVGISYAGVWAYQNLRMTGYTDPDTRVSVRYSTKLEVEKATAERDRRDKIVFRVKVRGAQGSGSGTDFAVAKTVPDPLLITVRYEDDLRKVSNTLRKDLLDILVDNSEKVFAQEYIKYEKVSQRAFEHKGRRAAEIVFTYLSPYGKFVKQRFMILIRDENTAFYLSAQASKERFDALNKRYFNKLFSSMDFQ